MKFGAQTGYSLIQQADGKLVVAGGSSNDGNSGSQGTGGALTAAGTTTVNITPVNNSPSLGVSTLVQAVSVGVAADVYDFIVTDVDSPHLTVTLIGSNLHRPRQPPTQAFTALTPHLQLLGAAATSAVQFHADWLM